MSSCLQMLLGKSRLKIKYLRVISRRTTSGTFVSKHYSLPPKELYAVLDIFKNQSDIRSTSDGAFEVKECHLCLKGNKSKIDNVWKLKIHKEGSYHCFRCAQHGSWFDLKRIALGTPESSYAFDPSYALGNNGSNGDMEDGVSRQSSSQVLPQVVIPNQKDAFRYHRNLFSNLKIIDEDALFGYKRVEEAYKYIENKRGISLETCRTFDIGLSVQQFPCDEEPHESPSIGDASTLDSSSNNNTVMKSKKRIYWRQEVCLTFPWMCNINDLTPAEAAAYEALPQSAKNIDVASVILRCKMRAISTKGKQRLLPKGGSWGFFGWQLVEPTHKELIITEGEFDTMAVHQALQALPATDPLRSVPVVSLPNGCNSLPPELVAKLERFDKLYLWLDNDAPGQAAAEKFAKKLGLHRCVVVRPLPDIGVPSKDANEALLKEQDIPLMLRKAVYIPDERIQTFTQLRDLVLVFADPSAPYEGTLVNSLPRLNTITKGFRKGELIILTGPTGMTLKLIYAIARSSMNVNIIIS
jgi:twinkle protein